MPSVSPARLGPLLLSAALVGACGGASPRAAPPGTTPLPAASVAPIARAAGAPTGVPAALGSAPDPTPAARTAPPCPDPSVDPAGSSVVILDCFPGPSARQPDGARVTVPQGADTAASANLAVSGTRLVIANDSFLAVYTRTGVLLDTTYWDQIFASLTGADWGYTAGWVTFDPASQRFFVGVMGREFPAAGCLAITCAGAVLVAVSRTATPSSVGPTDWYRYRFNGDISRLPGGVVHHPGAMIDDPVLAVYRGWLLISSTVMSIGPHQFIYPEQLRVIPLAPLLRGGSVTTWRDFVAWRDPASGQPSFRVLPALMVSDAPVLYLVGHANCGFNVWSIDLAAPAPSPQVWPVPASGPLGACGPLDPIPQPGTALPLDPGDTAMRAVPIFRDGRLWMAKENGAPYGTGVGVATWAEVDLRGGLAHATLVQAGREQIAGTWVTHPSIMVTRSGTMLLAFQLGGPKRFASLALAARQPADPLGGLRRPRILKAGSATLAGAAGATGQNLSNVQDFGKSALALDPLDGTAWVIGQYVGNPERWTTWIAHIR